MDLRDDEHPDPRLDPYRGRVGVLSRDGVEVGHVLVETDFAVLRTSGRLWWATWAEPVECAVVSTLPEDDPGPFFGEELDDLLADWDRGKHRGQDVTWLDQAASDLAHREVFGHHH